MGVYRVEELAASVGISVDTVRYYQGRGLLGAPERQGRVAVYGDEHLARLREIRDLAARGFTLAQIAALAKAGDDPDLSTLARANTPDPTLDRAALAARAGVSEFIIDIVIGAGLLTPIGEGERERFTADAVDMLDAARALVAEGVSIEELTALAMRHALHVEALVDDAIDIFRRRSDGNDDARAELASTLDRLAPVASNLVAQHFERTLLARALDRLGHEPVGAAGAIVVFTRHLDRRHNPVHLGADAGHRMVWLRPDADVAIVATGEVAVIEPTGDDRFSAASAARAALAARIRRHGSPDGPVPVLMGGFAFAVTEPRHQFPDWSGFGDARFVLPELTVIDRSDGTWLLGAARVGADGDESATVAAIEERLDAAEAALDDLDPPAPAGSARLALGDPDTDGHYVDLVASGVAAVESGSLDKVVLARAHTARGACDTNATLQHLCVANPSCAVFAITIDGSTFFGATPEQLVVLDHSQLHTMALAGTVPRGSTPAEDDKHAQRLVSSPKLRAEHAFVVTAIVDQLADLGLVDPTPAEPDVMRLSRVQHLRTPISATVQRRSEAVSDMDVFRVAGILHPTPAVGGTPSVEALDFIADNERFDRGWYAGPVGWCDLDGNGELRVALRTALCEGDRVHLFAGAGIVADSDPVDELDETTVKLRALLDALEAP